jgi:hypothetical protein
MGLPPAEGKACEESGRPMHGRRLPHTPTALASGPVPG